ncbi:hypothetical protein AB0D49_23025 [Streptomyces sp. NPDC048290]|uniref:Rv1733c family protein n=1 Tax=Streptomyces sp. NPDC048290 TaxID=3155811 RepID=UPI00341C9CF0
MSGVVPSAQPPPPLPERPVRPVRFWRWRRNPLRRRTDRIEARITLALLLLVPPLGCAALVAAGDTAQRHYRAVAEREARTRHQVTAVVIGAAPPAEVRLTAPDGRTRTVLTAVPPGRTAGDTVRVWVSSDGTPTGPPMPAGEIRSRAVGWAMLAFLTVALLGYAVHAIAVLALRWRNLAAWDARWAETAPRWTTSP